MSIHPAVDAAHLREQLSDPDDCASLARFLDQGRQAELTSLLLDKASDPVWEALARAFEPADAVLSRFTHLGPLHAAAHQHAHHGLVAFAVLLFDGLERDDGPDDARAELVERAPILAEAAAQMSWNKPLLTLTAPSGRSVERAALVLEAAGSDRNSHRARRRQLAKSLVAARTPIWAALGGEGAAPALVTRRRGDDLGEGVVGQLTGHRDHERLVFVDVERFALAAAIRAHRLPDLDGMDVADLTRFEPCAAMAAGLTADEPGMVLLHELVHARAATDFLPFAPSAEHLDIAEQVRQIADPGLQLSTMVLRCGLAVALDLGDSDRHGDSLLRPLTPWVTLDEAVVELAARRLAHVVRLSTDPELWGPTISAPLWGGLLAPAESSYMSGVNLMDRLLPPGTDLVELLTAPDRFARMRQLLAGGPGFGPLLMADLLAPPTVVGEIGLHPDQPPFNW